MKREALHIEVTNGRIHAHVKNKVDTPILPTNKVYIPFKQLLMSPLHVWCVNAIWSVNANDFSTDNNNQDTAE